jgi:hypothetical protein
MCASGAEGLAIYSSSVSTARRPISSAGTSAALI